MQVSAAQLPQERYPLLVKVVFLLVNTASAAASHWNVLDSVNKYLSRGAEHQDAIQVYRCIAMKKSLGTAFTEY